MILGVFYGHEITKESQEQIFNDKNVVAKSLISSGKLIANAYLQCIDCGKAFWFLYKTGQLSYEYYKTYETLDRKFAIQNKVDAWNQVFVEGKQKFDAWEQENEVGRTILAGLRTVWLVDEQSRKRTVGRSRYRVVQYIYDIRQSMSRLVQKSFSSVRSLFQEGEIRSFFEGLRTDLYRDGSATTRLGAVGAAIVAVNIGGAIFSISPVFSNFFAVMVAIIWPSWATDFISRSREVGFEIKSRGFKEGEKLSRSSVKVFDPLKFVRRRCQEYQNDKLRKSKPRKQNYRKPGRFSNNKKVQRRRRKPLSLPNFIDWRKSNSRGASEEVGTWAYFKRTQ